MYVDVNIPNIESKATFVYLCLIIHFMAILAIVFFLLLSAMFSASEIAFISANKLAIEIQKNKGNRKSRIISSFYENHQKFLGTMLVGNNIALVVFTSLMTKLLQPYIESVITGKGLLLLVNTLIITVIVLIFGEFLPKTIARIYAYQYIKVMTYILAFFKSLLSIPTWLMTVTSSFLLKYLLRAPVEQVDNPITRLDLENFIDSEVDPEDEDIETELFKNALNLKDIKVRDCMVPRNELVFIEMDEDINSLIKLFRESGHSRLLVAKEGVDDIVGYVHHQSLIDKPNNIKKILRDIEFVPEAMNVHNLLTRFVSTNVSLACVVDEFGGTAGIITLEDILEEIFGEIEDEHDVEEHTDVQLNETQFLFSGRLELDYINGKYDELNIPEGEYHTLSGYIVMTAGTIPEEGDVVDLDNLRFYIESVSDTKIDTIKVEIINPDDENS